MTDTEDSKQNNHFLEVHKEGLEVLGFWTEEYRSSILHSLENRYKTEIIIEWGISDLLINGDKVLVKWYKRIQPLSKQELKDNYGR